MLDSSANEDSSTKTVAELSEEEEEHEITVSVYSEVPKSLLCFGTDFFDWN